MRTLGVAALFVVGLAPPGICAGYADLNAGIAATNRGDWDKALLYLDQALAAGDLTADQQYVAHVDRSRVRLAKKDMGGAEADMEAAAALKPGDQTAQTSLARSHMAAGKLDAARHDADLLIAAHPDDFRTYLFRGWIDEAMGDAESELKDVQAYQLHAHFSRSPALELGIANFELGRFEAAADLLTEEFDRSPNDDARWQGWLWLALAERHAGKPVPDNADTLFTHVPKSKWPGPLVEFFLGHSTEDAVREFAKQGDAPTQLKQICETNFFIGEWRMAQGDVAGGKALLAEAAKCPAATPVWYKAQGALKHAP